MDFGLLPPEINSGRMYAGPGPGPMLSAAAAWDGLAAELHSTAASYSSVVSELTAGWHGPSSATMAAAAAPYAAWMNTTAAQAEQTATQAKAAVAAYETAFAATVPPPVIAANRSLLTTLIATNFLGQNTAAIAAAEAQYAEMWAQDAVAMYGYAGQSATASQVTPFNSPPQTTDPAGTAQQGAAVARATGTRAAATAVPQNLAAPAATSAATAAQPVEPPFTPSQTLATLATSFFNATIGPYSPVKVYDPLGAFYDLGVQSFLAPFNNFQMQSSYLDALGGTGNAASGATLPPGAFSAFTPGAGSAVSADVGGAGLVGNLSVPQGWASAAPAIRPVATVLQQGSLGAVPATIAADGQGGLLGNMALSGLAGRAVAGTGGAAAPSVGGAAGAVPGGAATTATTATIIVINDD